MTIIVGLIAILGHVFYTSDTINVDKREAGEWHRDGHGTQLLAFSYIHITSHRNFQVFMIIISQQGN
jgi:hypothetical protein